MVKAETSAMLRPHDGSRHAVRVARLQSSGGSLVFLSAVSAASHACDADEAQLGNQTANNEELKASYGTRAVVLATTSHVEAATNAYVMFTLNVRDAVIRARGDDVCLSIPSPAGETTEYLARPGQVCELPLDVGVPQGKSRVRGMASSTHARLRVRFPNPRECLTTPHEFIARLPTSGRLGQEMGVKARRRIA